MVEFKRVETRNMAAKKSKNKARIETNSVFHKKFSAKFLDQNDDLSKLFAK